MRKTVKQADTVKSRFAQRCGVAEKSRNGWCRQGVPNVSYWLNPEVLAVRNNVRSYSSFRHSTQDFRCWMYSGRPNAAAGLPALTRCGHCTKDNGGPLEKVSRRRDSPESTLEVDFGRRRVVCGFFHSAVST